MPQQRQTPDVLDVFVVSHTHWDREWYRSAGEFRQLLVPLIDDLLDHAATAPFLLDGQAVVLDDYLSVRPERAAELRTAFREGRLEAGPWYVLADELIPSGEALIRNLLAGRRTLRAIGATAPPVLYSPDAFGHTGSLATLAAGFAARATIVWRGYGGRRWPSGDVVRWRAADGSEVLLLHLPPDGYEFGASLPSDEPGAAIRWNHLREVLLPRSTTGIVLLPNGADHHARQRDLSEAVASLARVARPHRVHLSGLSQLTDAISRRCAARRLPGVSGELRDSYGYTWTLAGTLASRAYQKRQNAMAERLLIRDVEPWVAFAARQGDATAGSLADAAWRTLLTCHPHDSLCGCSTDEVADAVELRLASVYAQGAQLRDITVRSLLGHDPDTAMSQRDRWRPRVIVRNRAARVRSGIAELELDVKLGDVPVGPASSDVELPSAGQATGEFQLAGASKCQGVGQFRTYVREEAPRHYPRNVLVERRRVLVWVRDVPAYGLRALGEGVPSRAAYPGSSRARTRGRGIANGRCSVEVTDAGLAFRVDERVVSDLLVVEARGEKGDLYTPSAIAGTVRQGALHRTRITARGPLRSELTTWWRVPVMERSLTSATGEPIFHPASTEVVRIRFQLDAATEWVRILADGTWTSLDARLRLIVRTGLAGSSTAADAAFGDVTRSPPAVPLEDQSAELVQPTAPLHRFVSRFAGTAGATLFSDGLAEYESGDDGSIAVTLVRAVGELSRADLPERPGHAGWPTATPGAQALGSYEAGFALALHGPRTARMVGQIHDWADDILLPLTGSTWSSAIDPPESLGGVALRGDGLALSSIKLAESREWTVLRCLNVTEEWAPGCWQLAGVTEARLARLDETALGALPVTSNGVEFVAPPRAVVTVLVR